MTSLAKRDVIINKAILNFVKSSVWPFFIKAGGGHFELVFKYCFCRVLNY